DDRLIPVDLNDDILKRNGRNSLLRGPDNVPLLGDWLPRDWTRYQRGMVAEGLNSPSEGSGMLSGGLGLPPEESPTFLARFENWTSPEGKEAWQQWGRKPSSHYLLATVYDLVLVGLIVGFRPRLMALCAALLASTFFHRFWEMTNGADNFFRNGLYLLILAPSGLTWSVDHWLR